MEGADLHMLGTQPIRKSHMHFPVLTVFVFNFESLTEYLILMFDLNSPYCLCKQFHALLRKCVTQLCD